MASNLLLLGHTPFSSINCLTVATFSSVIANTVMVKFCTPSPYSAQMRCFPPKSILKTSSAVLRRHGFLAVWRRLMMDSVFFQTSLFSRASQCDGCNATVSDAPLPLHFIGDGSGGDWRTISYEMVCIGFEETDQVEIEERQITRWRRIRWRLENDKLRDGDGSGGDWRTISYEMVCIGFEETDQVEIKEPQITRCYASISYATPWDRREKNPSQLYAYRGVFAVRVEGDNKPNELPRTRVRGVCPTFTEQRVGWLLSVPQCIGALRTLCIAADRHGMPARDRPMDATRWASRDRELCGDSARAESHSGVPGARGACRGDDRLRSESQPEPPERCIEDVPSFDSNQLLNEVFDIKLYAVEIGIYADSPKSDCHDVVDELRKIAAICSVLSYGKGVRYPWPRPLVEFAQYAPNTQQGYETSSVRNAKLGFLKNRRYIRFCFGSETSWERNFKDGSLHYMREETHNVEKRRKRAMDIAATGVEQKKVTCTQRQNKISLLGQKYLTRVFTIGTNFTQCPQRSRCNRDWKVRAGSQRCGTRRADVSLAASTRSRTT
ncbi:hypothetical protein EVAR_58219_1 [Eumeta japonica]|uniref:Uncharacterized protein n=1 Tax=Eumeta variegata TaxID=151549 RepID=A0A4C1ZRG4_EUMVA|nr:hypothetical protein EVAR_58219_1 [Eumeta japonica]